MDEERVPVKERVLLIQSLASPEIIEVVEPVLTKSPENSRVCFVSYSYADIPVGKEFEMVFFRHRPHEVMEVTSRIIAVTQQNLLKLDWIPYGDKTVCLIEFPEGVPSYVSQLPVADGWHILEDPVCISSRETWQSRLDQYLRKTM